MAIHDPKNAPYHLYLGYVTQCLVEDRMEYSIDDLKTSEELNEEQACVLWDLLQHKDDDDYNPIETCIGQIYGRGTMDAIRVIKEHADPVTSEFFVEANHSSWDGWEPNHIPTILQLVQDLAHWHTASRKDK